MYQEEFKRWLAADLEDPDLKPELSRIEGNNDEIKERFAVALKFGTAGLRGVLGAGTNRMNIYVIRQATQGLANWVKTQGGTQTVAISYDSRLKSDVFAKTAAGVLAANGIKVRIYDALMPVPALSFATRYYQCNAGVMVTASHNPAKYNGYKAYGPDGCQMTDDAAAIVYEEIQKTDVLTGAKYMSFAEGVEEGLIRFVGDDCKKALYEAIESRQVRPGLCSTAGLKLVYSPLNGSGLVPVTRVLKDIGITDITIVPEQEYPNGYFTTCSYPNPEIFEALELGLKLAEETEADLMLATDPDADRLGVYVKDTKSGEYICLTGNMSGSFLAEYEIGQKKALEGSLPEDGELIKTIVTTNLVDAMAKYYGIKVTECLTGFKWIGREILRMETSGKGQYLFGFEESYGCLIGTHARDKDAIVASMALCEAAAYYKLRGMTIWDAMLEMYERYGYYKDNVIAITHKGIEGLEKIKSIMDTLRKNPPMKFGKYDVLRTRDYDQDVIRDVKTGETTTTGIPKSNVLYFELTEDAWLCVRPSGTEPKIKIYFGVVGSSLEDADAKSEELAEVVQKMLAEM